MTRTPTRRRSPDDPPIGDRRAIEGRIRLLPLMRRDQPGVLDWPTLAVRLAGELTATTARLSAVRGLSEADQEQIARSEIVLRDFALAAAAERGGA